MLNNTLKGATSDLLRELINIKQDGSQTKDFDKHWLPNHSASAFKT